ncbi:Na+/H+ antiporter subunit E [Thiomicrospira microaerophila]|uniref:Na+/H+ antiporter subunit E n=1 Tax=Thiomicrospira microaerophila TaxID=406020 RepID=UPI0020105B2F|nr:Na+/H+ antiporter subunit E [Thiomicrospira microaerophila]UQB42737.1 Na+/H+ antiporter subunit E [Thiomicrospira microaerophila]
MLHKFLRFSVYFFGLTVCWWALTEGDNQAWWFGAPLALIIAVWMLGVWPSVHLRLSNILFLLPRIILFFLWQSIQGGWDVAKRAMARTVDIEPLVLTYELQLPVGWRRDIWLAMIGLMPGTLAVGLEGNKAKVHVLDKRLDVQAGLVRFEYLLLMWR